MMEFPNQPHTAYAQFIYPAGYAGSVAQDPSETAEAQAGLSQPQAHYPLSWDHGHHQNHQHHQDVYGRPLTASSSIKQASISSSSIDGSPVQHQQQHHQQHPYPHLHQHQHQHQPQHPNHHQQHHQQHRHHRQQASPHCSQYCSPCPQNLYLDLNQTIVLPTTSTSPSASPYHQPVLPSQHILPDLLSSIPTDAPQSPYSFHEQYSTSSLHLHNTATPTPQDSSPHGSPLLTSAYEQAEHSIHLQNSDPYRTSPVPPAAMMAAPPPPPPPSSSSSSSQQSSIPPTIVASTFKPAAQVTQTGKRTPTSGRYMCFSPNCGRSFTRVSDLNRHISTVHFTQQSRRFNCPKADCKRKGSNAFTRRDHLLEHLRHIHREKLSKSRRGITISAAEPESPPENAVGEPSPRLEGEV